MPDDATSLALDFTVEDIEYRRYGDRALLARLYRPKGAGPFPAVVDIHGGAWVNGDRLSDAPIAEHLARHGILVLSLDFRVPPEAGYPASLQDINYGIRWLKSRATAFGSRPDLVGALGSSSGGHQLMLGALRPSDPRYAALPLPGGHDASLRFAIPCWAVADPLRRYHFARAGNLEQMVANHHAFWPDEAAMEEGNPQRILDRGEAVALPPILVIQGTNDDNMPPDMADNFVVAYRKAGGSVRFEKYQGAPHGFINREPETEAAKHALDRIVAFVREQTA